MVDRHSGGGFSREFIKIRGGNALVDAAAYFLRNQNGITVLGVQSMAEFLDTRGYLVELNGFLASISLYHVHVGSLGFESFDRKSKIEMRRGTKWLRSEE